jgi:NAD(P)-dependent dehydrogenase (short-subunit alcohol dehydrogenase family)
MEYDTTLVTDKTIIITGASDGIGAAAARQLKSMGANVVIVGRSLERTKAIADKLGAKYYLADFSQLSDVRKLAEELKRDFKKIDVLVNNAGGIFGKRTLTEDGHEVTLQVNHLAPFLLTNLLIDVLVSSKATVINTSSVANKILSKFNIDDLENEKNYSPESAYGNAKLENILFTKELHKKYSDSGISTAAFHPGNVATSFSKESASFLRFVYKTFLRKLILISPEKGADTLVWLSSATPGKDWDTQLAAELWKWSAEAVV